MTEAIGVESDWLRVEACADGGLRLTELVDLQEGLPLLAEETCLCRIVLDGEEAVVDTLERPSAKELLVRWADQTARIPVAQLRITLDGPSLRWRLDPAGRGRPCKAYLPFLANLRLDPAVADWTIAGEPHFRNGLGRPVFRHADWPLPVVRVGADGRTLTSLVTRFPGSIALEPQLVSGAPGMPLGSAPNEEAGLEGELLLHHGGWPVAFDVFRQRVRETFDLSEYERPELSWYRNQLVHHFTFLYGREMLDPQTGRLELDRFLDEGERDFGGYDGMLVWGVYPRLGVDERTQWDFYDDLPGGREGLRAMARRARERGVRFFVPYKPWDRSADMHGRPTRPDPELLAELVADVDADGVFLDTMSAVDTDFRHAMDEQRQGVVFCSEGRAKGSAFEVITGSWDQSLYHDMSQGDWSASEEVMPEVDLYRFVFPEHPLFVINRHAMGEDRIRIIQRGFFNGMGWVVWQDVFGLVLPYSPAEARLLKKCRGILRRHTEVLRAPHPTPLVDTLVPGVYANEFENEAKRVWTLYNSTDSPVGGPVLEVNPREGHHFVDLWEDEELAPDADGRLCLSLGPKAVGAVAEVPRILKPSSDGTGVKLAAPAPGAVYEVTGSGAGRTEVADGAGVLDLEEALRRSTTGARVVRLIADGELLDQLVLPNEVAGVGR